MLMDHLTFDKSGRIQELIQTARCRLLYLPPYSPEFYKEESWLKSQIRKQLDEFDCLHFGDPWMSCALRPNTGGCYM
ncbi:transposase [Microcoleus sp. S13_C5]